MSDAPFDLASFYARLPAKRVAAGALCQDAAGRVLLVEPTYKDVWELPGGMVEADESPLAACRRELREELGIEVTPACLAPFVFASHGYESFHLLMPLYLIRRWIGVVAPHEHAAVKWVKPARLGDYPMPPADEPLVAYLRDFL